MREKTGSAWARWLAFFALAIAAVPMIWTWRASVGQSAPMQALNWPEPADGEGWVRPNEIAVQFKQGADNNTLSMLGTALGAPLAWNSSLGAQTGIARLMVPPGMTSDALLAKLRKDPN